MCLHVARISLDQVDAAAQKADDSGKASDAIDPTLTNIADDLQNIRDFECPEDDPVIRQLLEDMDLVAAQITDPYIFPGVGQELGLKQPLPATADQISTEKALR